MAVIVWPVDAAAGAPSYTGRMLRETQSPFLVGATSARPLGARSGVRPGTSTTTVTATSTVWTVSTHAGVLDLETAALAGPYAYAVNTAQTGAVTAAHATLARVDIVWMRLDDPAESDGSSVPAVVAGYTAGTAAGSPVAPATPARCMVLATIQVPLSGGGSPTVIWAAPYTVSAGSAIPVRTQAERDALTAYDGLAVYRLDTHVTESYNGTSWVTAPPTLGASVGFKGTANIGSIIGADRGCGNAPSVTGDGVKKYKITASFYNLVSTVAADTFIVKINSTNPAATLTQRLMICNTVNAGGETLVVTDIPPAGSTVYSLVAIRNSGTGTGTMAGGATTPIEMIVEQIT